MNHKLFLSKEEESGDSVCNLKGNAACDKIVAYFSNEHESPKFCEFHIKSILRILISDRKSLKKNKASVG